MNTLLFIFKIFPLLITSVQQIESLAPVAKSGPSKLKLITDTVASAFNLDSTATGSVAPTTALSVVEAVTANIVAFCNQLGIFKKSA